MIEKKQLVYGRDATVREHVIVKLENSLTSLQTLSLISSRRFDVKKQGEANFTLCVRQTSHDMKDHWPVQIISCL